MVTTRRAALLGLLSKAELTGIPELPMRSTGARSTASVGDLAPSKHCPPPFVGSLPKRPKAKAGGGRASGRRVQPHGRSVQTPTDSLYKPLA
jgi:hypothetical protein